MRLRISLAAEGGPLRLPVQYNHLLQGLVYHNLDRVLSEWLHEEAHVLGKRRFKLFTFSRLFGKREMRNGHIGFAGPLHFYLGAVDARVLGSLAEHLLTKPAVRLGNSFMPSRTYCSEPTYEDLKPYGFTARFLVGVAFGAYLRGFETWWSRRNHRRCRVRSEPTYED